MISLGWQYGPPQGGRWGWGSLVHSADHENYPLIVSQLSWQHASGSTGWQLCFTRLKAPYFIFIFWWWVATGKVMYLLGETMTTAQRTAPDIPPKYTCKNKFYTAICWLAISKGFKSLTLSLLPHTQANTRTIAYKACERSLHYFIDLYILHLLQGQQSFLIHQCGVCMSRDGKLLPEVMWGLAEAEARLINTSAIAICACMSCSGLPWTCL